MRNDPLINWLLESGQPALAYRTLYELLDHPPDDAEVQAAKSKLLDSSDVQKMLSTMHPEGYWLQLRGDKSAYIGDDVEYGSYATTHFVLSYLAELGLTREVPQVALAADRYLSLQKEDGDFWNHYSCLFTFNIRTFIRLGYRQDERLKRTIQLMLNTERPDNGYLCETHEGKRKKRPVKSCIRGSLKALRAFAELPEYWQHPRCLGLVDYFLERDGIFRRSDLQTLARRELEMNYFPFTWQSSLLEVLLGLSKMGYGKDDRLSRAWAILDERRDEEGRYILDWTPSQCPWKVGKRGEANEWVTFYALLAKKFRKEGKTAI